MKHDAILGTRFFFATGLIPCPYLPGRLERRIVTELAGRDAAALHDQLSLAGFRRSHDIAYAPACPSCDACKAVRVIAEHYRPNRSMRRVRNANADVRARDVSPIATDEQFALFAAYQAARHASGEMARMDAADYRALVEDSPVDTRLVEFRNDDHALLGCCLIDRLGDGLSAVYSFFDPAIDRRSLGSLMILWTIRETQSLGLPYTYLGFWVAACSKMSYKARFQPLEVYTPQGWVPLAKTPPASSFGDDA
jgi:arginine-tRNA-protein transferase